MPRNKLHKYERVRHLSNVTFSVYGESHPPRSYPWYNERYEDMQLVVELGCGKGEHSLAFAAADPAKLCVGIDGKSHRICVGAEKALYAGLDNVLFLRARIERIGEFFTTHSISEIWLTFPDPHPKNREAKFRLTAPSFLDAYANLLIPGGGVCLLTDSDSFFAYTRKTVEHWGGRVLELPESVAGADFNPPYTPEVVSAYENAARLSGRRIKHMVFKLN